MVKYSHTLKYLKNKSIFKDITFFWDSVNFRCPSILNNTSTWSIIYDFKNIMK